MAYKAELAEAADTPRSSTTIRERLNRLRSPYRAAENFDIEEIIDPRETRPLLCRWANLVAGSRRAGRQAFTYRP